MNFNDPIFDKVKNPISTIRPTTAAFGQDDTVEPSKVEETPKKAPIVIKNKATESRGTPTINLSAGKGLLLNQHPEGATISLLPVWPNPAGKYNSANIAVDEYGKILSISHGAQGTVTDITCIAPLSGGVISSSGVISLEENSITSKYLADGPNTLTAGTYSSADLTVDQKGLIIAAKNGAVVRRFDVGPGLTKQQTGNGIFTIDISPTFQSSLATKEYVDSAVSEAVATAVAAAVGEAIAAATASLKL